MRTPKGRGKGWNGVGARRCPHGYAYRHGHVTTDLTQMNGEGAVLVHGQ